MSGIRIRDCLEPGARLLAVSDSPRLDLELLLAHSLCRGRSWLAAHLEDLVTPSRLAVFRGLLERRQSGEPMAYILGCQEFWSLSLKVDSRVLIPRPETELLVEAALQRCKAGACRVADLGTGSGAISAALLSETHGLSVLAVDISSGALSLARQNLAALGFESRVQFLQADWGGPLREQSLDLLVCNPPYLADQDPHLARLAFEPRRALVSGRRGLAALERVALDACRLLRQGGWLLLEHGCCQGEALRKYLTHLGYYEVQTLTDIAGLPRVTLGRQKR